MQQALPSQLGQALVELAAKTAKLLVTGITQGQYGIGQFGTMGALLALQGTPECRCAIRRIAIADPEAVPAGVYAKQYLQKVGIWDELAPRIVPAGSVRAALSAVESGAADAAIVYRTDARIATHATVAWVVPASEGPPIRYPAAVIRTSSVPEEAQRFLDYLRSAAGMRVLTRFGFAPIR